MTYEDAKMDSQARHGNDPHASSISISKSTIAKWPYYDSKNRINDIRE
jgi:hypothetical protein